MKNLFVNLFLAAFWAVAIGSVLAIDPLIPFAIILSLQVLRAFVGSPLPNGILASAVDVAALTAYAGKNKAGLLATMVNSMDFLNDVMIDANVKNKLRIGKLNVADGVRPFSSNEEFQDDDLQYTDRFLEVYAAKREIKIEPEKYRQTYLSEVLMAGSGANQMQIPYEAFTWREIFKSMWAEVNDNTAWEGFDESTATDYAAGSTYAVDNYITYTPTGKTVKQWYKCVTITTAGQSPDTNPEKWVKVTSSALFKGFGTRIIEEVTATNLSPITIGAITGTAGVARGAFLELFRSMPVTYRKKGVIINCSYTDFEFLLDDIEEISKYTRPSVTEGPGQTPDYIILPNTSNKCIVKPATWMTGRRMVAGPLNNLGGQYRNAALIFGTDLLRDWNDINIMKSELWTIKAGIKFLGGTQIANLEEIRINDQL